MLLIKNLKEFRKNLKERENEFEARIREILCQFVLSTHDFEFNSFFQFNPL
jgi:hypothetical protein